MEFSIMYAEYLPALMSFIITLIWVCMSAVVFDEPPPLLVWGAMVCVILGGASIFMLPLVSVWVIFFGQIGFSFVLMKWFKGNTHLFAFLKSLSKSSARRDIKDTEIFQDRVLGK